MVKLGPDDPEANATGGEMLPGVPMQPEEPQDEQLFAKGARELPPDDEELPPGRVVHEIREPLSVDTRLSLLVQGLETLLHEELPAMLRDVVGPMQKAEDLTVGGFKNMVDLVNKLDRLQREIGMATYELMRKGRQVQAQPPLTGMEDDGAGGLRPLPRRPQAAPRTGPSCSKAACSRTAGVSACGDCGKLYCPAHHDPALHPCGEEM